MAVSASFDTWSLGLCGYEAFTGRRLVNSTDFSEARRVNVSATFKFVEEETWGVQAAWVDYSGPLANGDQWGHTVVDHKDNPRHQTYWHVRGYGLFTANPFGLHDFKGDKSIDGSLTIPGGGQAVFRYRLIIHPGRGLENQRHRELIDEFQA